MDHGGDAARPATMEPVEVGMAAAVPAGEVHVNTDAVDFDSQLGVAAVRRGSFNDIHSGAAYRNPAGLAARQSRTGARRAELLVPAFGGELGRPGEVYADVGTFRRQPGQGDGDGGLLQPADADGVRRAVHDSYGCYALLPRSRVGRGEPLLGLPPDCVGAGYDGDYELLPRPGAGRGEVLVNVIYGGVGVAYDNYGHYAMQPGTGAGGGGEVLVVLLPDGLGAVYDDNYGDHAYGTLPGSGTERASDGMVRALPVSNFGSGYGSSAALAGSLSTVVYDSSGTLLERIRRLLPAAGVLASSTAVTVLSSGTVTPAAGFGCFALLLAGLSAIMIHVLRA